MARFSGLQAFDWSAWISSATPCEWALAALMGIDAYWFLAAAFVQLTWSEHVAYVNSCLLIGRYSRTF
jgi:hypothetical protein